MPSVVKKGGGGYAHLIKGSGDRCPNNYCVPIRDNYIAAYR